jgi:hypothetical protein
MEGNTAYQRVTEFLLGDAIERMVNARYQGRMDEAETWYRTVALLRAELYGGEVSDAA